MTTNSQKVAMVTAGAGGIGAVLTLAFQRAGYTVHVCDISERALGRFLDEHPAISGHCIDVADPDQVARCFEELGQRFGHLDVLVNNAGIAGPTAPAESIETEDWKRTLAVDLDGPFYCARAAIPWLRRTEGGTIINIASTAGLFGYPNRLPYAVSKWGLVGMTKTLAMELGPEGIRVNAVCPGSVSGARIEGVLERDAEQRGVSKEDVRLIYERQCSLRTFIDPEDVADMALFLASRAAARISGQAMAVDGHTEGLYSFSD